MLRDALAAEGLPASRATRGGLVSESYLQIGFQYGIPWDKFKFRKIGGRRGREGVSVNTGRKKFTFPKAFIYEDKMFERKPGQGRAIIRPRTQSPADYMQSGGLAVLRDYAAKRLQANVRDRLNLMILRAEQADGNG